ncbi:MAG: response regulator, partial [Caldilineaceae bacterium]|nr:response regulator [Caldilineaceae bacterium]
MSKNVLIVDDEPNIVISLEFLMEQAGYTTAVARTGDEALACIADFAPDLILLDVMLPGMSGFDICQTVRQTPDWQHIKIIMLTAKGRDVEVSKGLALGANAYITKPFSTKALMAEVQEQLTDHAATK